MPELCEFSLNFSTVERLRTCRICTTLFPLEKKKGEGGAGLGCCGEALQACALVPLDFLFFF